MVRLFNRRSTLVSFIETLFCIVGMVLYGSDGTAQTLYGFTITQTGAGSVTTVSRSGSCDPSRSICSSASSSSDCSSVCEFGVVSGGVLTLTATPASGGTFIGWGGACSGTASCSLVITSDKSVSASFSVPVVNYTLSVTKSGAGSGTVTSNPTGVTCGTQCTEYFTGGTNVTLAATPASASIFTGWSGACTNASGACNLSMTEAKSVTATFAPLAYPVAPTLITTYSVVGTLSGFAAGVDDVKVSGTLAYVVSGSTFSVVDISNKQLPVVIGSLSLAANGIQGRIALSGTKAYVTSDIQGGSKFYVIDIANPQKPVLLGTVPLLWPSCITVRGSYAYVCDSGVNVIDISNPYSPVLLGTQRLMGAYSIALYGDYALVGTGSSLATIDVSTPSAPSSVKWTETVAAAYSVNVSGNYLYVGQWNTATRGEAPFQVFDISNPLSPSLVATSVDTYGWLTASIDGTKYLINDSIVDITNPRQPVLQQDLGLGIVRAVNAADGCLYISRYPDLAIYCGVAASVPGAPTGVSVSVGNSQATVSFTAPTNSGGTDITGYTATCTASGQTTRTGTGSGTAITVSGLSSGVTYQCTVSATNGVGTGPLSSSVSATPAAMVPSAPTIEAATPGNGSATIAFSLPASNGATITGYAARCTANGQTTRAGAGDGTPLLVSGLANGAGYNCTVTATNSVGTSARSGTVSVTPIGGNQTIPEFAYVANNSSNTVSVYTINPTTGTLSVGTAVAAGSGPISVAADPNGKFLYVTNDDSHTVSVYAINPATGVLTAGTAVAAGTRPRAVTVDPTGKFAYVANFGANTVSVYAINPTTGALTAGTTVETGIGPVSITVDPTGRFVYVANDNSSNVSVFTINPTSGALTRGIPAAAGSSPFSVTVHPSGKFAYVANGTSDNVSVYTINPTTGALTAGAAVAAGSWPGAVTVDPSGKFAYVTNYVSNNISVYTINPTTGALTARTTVAAGSGPVSFTVDSTGKFAYVVNADSNNVSVYTINPASGDLTAVTVVAAGSYPYSVATTRAVATKYSVADCLFTWAERAYSALFTPAGSTSAINIPYYYRYYAATGNYLATSSADNHIWVFGPASGNRLLDVGPTSGFMAASGCSP